MTWIFLSFFILTDPLASQQRPHRGGDVCLLETVASLHSGDSGAVPAATPSGGKAPPPPFPVTQPAGMTGVREPDGAGAGCGEWEGYWACRPGGDSRVTDPGLFLPPPSSRTSKASQPLVVWLWGHLGSGRRRLHL